MRVYEELFIVRPEATPEELAPLIDQLKAVITQQGGTLDKQENWGVRRLAYKLKKYAEGQYILLVFTAEASTVHELERRLRVNDLVIKFITVRIDEKMKRIEKRKKAREKRAARKPATPPPAAPALPLFGAVEQPGPVPGAPAPGAPVPVEKTPEPATAE